MDLLFPEQRRCLSGAPPILAAVLIFFSCLSAPIAQAVETEDPGNYVGAIVMIKQGKVFFKQQDAIGKDCYSDVATTKKKRLIDSQLSESFEETMKFMNVGATVDGNYMGFSASAEVDYKSRMTSTRDSKYKVILSEMPLRECTLNEAGKRTLRETHFADVEVPDVPPNRSYSDQWIAFFERYGTHYIEKVTFGGQVNIVLRSDSKEIKSLEDFSTKAKLAYSGPGGGASGELSYDQNAEYASKVSGIKLTVDVTGGDLSKLPTTVSESEDSLKDWIGSVQDNPAPLQYDRCVPIWTLIPDPDRKIELAYKHLYDAELTGQLYSGDRVTLVM